MRDQDQRSGVLGQGRLQQLQRLDIQVVGRLIEHQQIGRTRKQPGQQQTIALAPRQRAYRGLRALRRKQEVGEVAGHVLAHPGNLDPVGPGRDGLGQRPIRIELLAQLVEIRNLQVGAQSYRAGIGRKGAQQQTHQGALARAVRSDQGQSVAAHQSHREALDQGELPETLADVAQFRHQAARTRPRIDLDSNLAQPGAAFGAVVPQPLQSRHAPRVARAPSLDALADPRFLLRPEPVEASPRQVFGGELLGPARLVGGKIARVRAQHPSIQLDDPGRHAVEKTAVVRDHDRRPAAPLFLRQQRFQMFYAVDVQMIGRLVQQQQVRFERKRERERGALSLTAGKTRRVELLGKPEPVQVLDQPCLDPPALALVVRFGQAAAHHQGCAQGCGGRHSGLLLDRHDAQAVAYAQLAIVQHQAAGDRGQQRALATRSVRRR